MKKIILLLAIAASFILVKSQALILATDYHGLTPYLWHAAHIEEIDYQNQTIATLSLYADELQWKQHPEFTLDNKSCVVDGIKLSNDSLYARIIRNCDYFSTAVYTDGYNMALKDSVVTQAISDDPINGYKRIVEIESCSPNFKASTMSMRIWIHFYSNNIEVDKKEIFWVVDNFYTVSGTNPPVGEYDYFDNYETSHNLTIQQILKIGITYGDLSGYINLRLGYKFNEQKWTK